MERDPPSRALTKPTSSTQVSRCRGAHLETFPSQDGQSPSHIGHLESISGRLKTSNAHLKSVAGTSQDGGVSKWTR
eukprot:4277505-Prymnesium_polylepis.1